MLKSSRPKIEKVADDAVKILYNIVTTMLLNNEILEGYQAVLYACEIWTLTNTSTTILIRWQRRLERATVGIRLRDRISSVEIRKKTKLENWLKAALERKWRFAAKLLGKQNWAEFVTEWIPKLKQNACWEGREPDGPMCLVYKWTKRTLWIICDNFEIFNIR